MSEPLIELIDVSKAYGKEQLEVRPLENLSLKIDREDFLALVGPSGSGKSTLLNLIAGIDAPTSGRVIFDGTDVSTMNDGAAARWRNQHIGFIFQAYNLIPVLTAFENVELPLLLTKLSSRERREHCKVALELVGLQDRQNHYPRQLSGGQEQRVAIARAIVTDPAVVLADEPTGDLDAKAAEDILQLLQELNQNLHKTIVMVTHDTRALQHARSWKRLDKGCLVDFAPVPDGGGSEN